jgi:hypothetical protein
MSERALVRNAADPSQVKFAARQEREREARFLSNLRSALASPEVRLVFAELLERAGLYQTVFDHSGSMVYFKEGRRNFGLELRALCEQASDELTDQMDRERRQRLRADHRTTDAVHTPRAEETSHVN